MVNLDWLIQYVSIYIARCIVGGQSRLSDTIRVNVDWLIHNGRPMYIAEYVVGQSRLFDTLQTVHIVEIMVSDLFPFAHLVDNGNWMKFFQHCYCLFPLFIPNTNDSIYKFDIYSIWYKQNLNYFNVCRYLEFGQPFQG